MVIGVFRSREPLQQLVDVPTGEHFLLLRSGLLNGRGVLHIHARVFEDFLLLLLPHETAAQRACEGGVSQVLFPDLVGRPLKPSFVLRTCDDTFTRDCPGRVCADPRDQVLPEIGPQIEELPVVLRGCDHPHSHIGALKIHDLDGPVPLVPKRRGED